MIQEDAGQSLSLWNPMKFLSEAAITAVLPAR